MAKRFTVEAVFKLTDKFSAPVKRLDKRIGSFSEKVTKGVKRASLALGGFATAFGFAAKSVLSSGASFQQTMANLRAVSGATDAQLSALQSTAMAVGKQFGFMPDAVASAMESMSKAGFGVADIEKAIGGLAAAAAADGSTIDEAVGSVMGAMKSLGLGASDTQMFADMLAKAGDTTAASIGSLTQSMAVFGPVAKSLGVPLDSAIAQLALLQDAGLDASTSGTSLASTYSKLAAPTGSTVKALKALNLQVTDAAGNFKKPDVLLNDLIGSMQKYSGNAEKMAIVTKLVGLESQKALLNLVSASESGKLEKLTGDLADATGYAQKLADVKNDTLIGDWNKFIGTIEALKIQLFDMESGALRGVVQQMTAWLEKNGTLLASGIGEFLQMIIDNFESIVTWGKRIAIVVGSFYALATAVKVVSTTIAVFKGLVAAATFIMKAFRLAVLLTQAAIFLLEGTIALPFILGIAAIAAIGAAVWYFWDELVAFGGMIGNFFVGIWDGIKNTFLSMITFLAQSLINFITGPARLAIMAAEKVGLLDDGTSAAITNALTIQSPQERTANAVSESVSKTSAEVTVKAPGMKAEVSKAPKKGSGLSLAASGGL